MAFNRADTSTDMIYVSLSPSTIHSFLITLPPPTPPPVPSSPSSSSSSSSNGSKKMLGLIALVAVVVPIGIAVAQKVIKKPEVQTGQTCITCNKNDLVNYLRK